MEVIELLARGCCFLEGVLTQLDELEADVRETEALVRAQLALEDVRSPSPQDGRVALLGPPCPR